MNRIFKINNIKNLKLIIFQKVFKKYANIKLNKFKELNKIFINIFINKIDRYYF